MNTSDWIGIICSAVSLVVTIIIAVMQINQSIRMEKFEKRQDDRDEKRHLEDVKSQAVSFVSKYYADRGLVPLCAIAAMYNELYYYSRPMYRDFCCCTKEVQNKILEYCQLDLRVEEIEVFNQCLNGMIKVLHKYFPKDRDIFYDGGKYIERCILRYGKEPIPHTEYEYEKRLTDILSEAFQNNDKSATPIKQISKEFRFEVCNEIEACQIAAVTAEYIAVYSGDESDKEYGAPGGYAGETIDTMEDLFLLSVFEMYVNIVEQK